MAFVSLTDKRLSTEVAETYPTVPINNREGIKIWRRQADLNRRIAVLQTAPLTTWVCRLMLQVKQTSPGKSLGLN